MTDAAMPGTIPELPREIGQQIECTTASGTYRITATKPNVWIFHRKGDMEWIGQLEKDGKFFDFHARGGIGTSGLSITLPILFTQLI
jgi:hypothetical protein